MNTQEPNLEAIAEKIQKLLALASSPFEAEALAATAKAQELLSIYNLDMLAVERAGKKDSAAREDKKLKGGLYKWQRDIWKDVAELNFCMYWSYKGLTKGSSYEHRVLGSKINVLSTRMMAEYLEQTIERIARAEYQNDSKHYFSKAAVAFREGMAARIGIRLRERRWEQKEKAREEAAAQATRAADERALTILDVEDAEYDANMDALHGAGYSARRRAEAAASKARWDKMMQEANEEEAAFKRDHPEAWAKREADRAKQRAADDKKWRNRKGRTYKAWSPRAASYYDGYEKGKDVSLDRQVDQAKRKEIE